MNYYNILNFKKDPFSNSPEPEFFFEAPKYISCLQKLELAVRLRRGLNVVIGGIGTGKTTLCRKLIQQLSLPLKDSQEIEIYLLLDPSFNHVTGFLQAICALIGVRDLDGEENEWQLKEKIKNYLFNKGVNENKIVVLIIDEGQKIPENCIETLREILNYETNNFKLLQIIIFAQPEFKKILKKHVNLADRINYLYYLDNLSFKRMREMINFRVNVAGNFENTSEVFTFCGMLAVYLATRGYPRKVIMLCHHVLLALIVRGKKKADYFLVRQCLNEMHSPLLLKLRWAEITAVLIVLAGTVFIQYSDVINYYKQLTFSYVMADTQKKSPIPNIPAVSAKSLPLQTPPVAPEAKSNVLIEKKIKMPEFLGILSITKGRTLWKTIEKIYGEVNPEIIKKVSDANQNISINKITAGQKIHFPAIPAEIKPVENSGYLVVLEKGNDLQLIYDLLRDNYYKKSLPGMLFFSLWNSREGMIFMIVLDKKFNNLLTAKEAIKALPNSITAKAQIIDHWDEDTVFFYNQRLKD